MLHTEKNLKSATLNIKGQQPPRPQNFFSTRELFQRTKINMPFLLTCETSLSCQIFLNSVIGSLERSKNSLASAPKKCQIFILKTDLKNGVFSVFTWNDSLRIWLQTEELCGVVIDLLAGNAPNGPFPRGYHHHWRGRLSSRGCCYCGHRKVLHH